MKVLKMCCIAPVAIGLTPAALADKYDDLAAKGYRWVTVDGPYGSPSRDDLLQIVKGRSEGKELEFIEQLRAYYLIPGTVVQVIQKDVASGMSQIHLDGVRRPLWTLSRFLSTRRAGFPDCFFTASAVLQRRSAHRRAHESRPFH